MIKRLLKRFVVRAKDDELPIPVTEIERKIDYQFKDKILLLKAFKHRSYLNMTHESALESNERLEFLGDAVLDLIIAEHLFHNFPNKNEGELSKKRSVLVSRQVLAQITEEIGLGEYLLLDKGEEKTGGRKRLNNLANLFESVLGAIYLDGGLTAARNFVNHFILRKREDLLKVKRYHNYKSELLEKAQSKGWGNPVYQIVHESGPDHNKQFVVRVNVNNRWLAKGVGSSKKKAEQLAARNALKKLGNNRNNSARTKTQKQRDMS
ncbi:Ribonuclease 3 [Caldithrix abyssi DSM 13497]|uniref:Ribonuclease 3 n=1 Tax=Caldithrix abyssi DSM 13497 TaxID=880073 RepID=H1XS94_CALAY|nr:ribonuclease III [Caldithrix abyssi]APF20200.1 rnc ribonuclease-3 [Caldithrix abyssi DSM 13497]EHO40258.1 Ribonuclease 3 [Caldithrix abyssi DSM 13497]